MVSTVTTVSHDDTVSAEKPLSWNVLLSQPLKRPAPIVFEQQGSYWYEKKRSKVFYGRMESFLQLSKFQKNTTCRNWTFLWKNIFFKLVITQKRKWYKKKLYNFLEQTLPLQMIWKSTLVIKSFTRWSIFRGPPFFPFSVNNSFPMKKSGETSQLLPQ